MSPPSTDERRPSHVGSWIVTYSDMITLLMAFFICIIAFAWKGEKRYDSTVNSILDGCAVWRPRLRPPPESAARLDLESVYRNPSAATSAQIIHILDALEPTRLTDNYAIRLPMNLLFEKGECLSPSGKHLLHALAEQLRDLPYDVQFQVSRVEVFPQAIKLCGFLAHQERYEPARLAVGSHPPQEADDSVWLVVFRQI